MPAESWVHVIDDDEAVRDSVAFLFETADLPVRTYESAMVFLDRLDAGTSGCIITDVRMPEMSGLDLIKALRARAVTLPVVVITGHGDVPLAVEAMKIGAFDFIEKPFDDERLLAVSRRALEQYAQEEPASAEKATALAHVAKLSPRERQVLRRLVDGQLNKTIAWELGISARTVEVYRAKLMSKMAAGSFADLVRMTLLAGNLED